MFLDLKLDILLSAVGGWQLAVGEN